MVAHDAHWTNLAKAAAPYVPPGFTGQLEVNIANGRIQAITVRQRFDVGSKTTRIEVRPK
jgi:hypothetical protein